MASVKIEGKMIKVTDVYFDMTPQEAEKLADELRAAARQVRGAGTAKPKAFWETK